MALKDEMIKHMSNLAFQIREFSTDQYMKVGCVGFTHGRTFFYGENNDKCCLTLKQHKDRDFRRKFMIHAELTMLKDAAEKGVCIVENVVITLFPCVHCMTALAIHGCRDLYYMEMYNKDKPAVEVAEMYKINIHKI